MTGGERCCGKEDDRYFLVAVLSTYAGNPMLCTDKLNAYVQLLVHLCSKLHMEEGDRKEEEHGGGVGWWNIPGSCLLCCSWDGDEKLNKST